MKNNNFKLVSFWIGILGCVLVIIQVVLNYFNINFEVKLFVDIFSYALTILVMFGVLKLNSDSNSTDSNSTTDAKDIQKEIKNEIEDEINNKKDT